MELVDIDKDTHSPKRGLHALLTFRFERSV